MQRSSPDSASKHLEFGTLLYEHRQFELWLVVLLIVASYLMLLSFVAITDRRGGGNLTTGIVMLLIAGAAFALVVWRASIRHRFYTDGAEMLRFGRVRRSIAYREARSMVCFVRDVRSSGGAHAGFTLKLKVHTASDQVFRFRGSFGGKAKFLAVRREMPDEFAVLAEVRDRIAAVIADRLEAELLDGQELFWGGTVQLREDGLVVSTWVRRDRDMAYGEITGVGFHFGNLTLHGPLKLEVARVPTGAENFWPMLMVFQRMAALHAQAAVTADKKSASSTD